MNTNNRQRDEPPFYKKVDDMKEPGSEKSPAPAITVKDLRKSFGSVNAVQGISFHVEQGELFGFLGPNGAGKTTTINMLTGLARSDGGTIDIDGIDCTKNPKAAQHLIGTVPDESNLYGELSGFDNLSFCGALYGMRKKEREARAEELLELFGLAEASGRKFAGYSKGMKRKLTFAAGIIHRPPILFLDEPTTGIDVASARQVRQIVAGLHEQGTTIFLTTHYIEEAERLCQRIAFIVRGQIVRTDRTADLLQPVQGKHVLFLEAENMPPGLRGDMATAFSEYAFEPAGQDSLRIESDRAIDIAPLTRFLEERGVRVLEARRHLPSLEDVFVRVTGIESGLMKREKEMARGGGNQ